MNPVLQKRQSCFNHLISHEIWSAHSQSVTASDSQWSDSLHRFQCERTHCRWAEIQHGARQSEEDVDEESASFSLRRRKQNELPSLNTLWLLSVMLSWGCLVSGGANLSHFETNCHCFTRQEDPLLYLC